MRLQRVTIWDSSLPRHHILYHTNKRHFKNSHKPTTKNSPIANPIDTHVINIATVGGQKGQMKKGDKQGRTRQHRKSPPRLWTLGFWTLCSAPSASSPVPARIQSQKPPFLLQNPIFTIVSKATIYKSYPTESGLFRAQIFFDIQPTLGFGLWTWDSHIHIIPSRYVDFILATQRPLRYFRGNDLH